MNAALNRFCISSRYAACGALLLALASTHAVALRAQQIYQSVDAQGHLVFSDRPDVTGAEQHVVPDEAQSPPQVLHFCWTNCFTLKAEDGVYSRTDGTDETWTVETFSPKAFVLRRHDAPAAWNGFKAEVTYAGEVANDRLINVTVDGSPIDGILMAWGSALDTLPGSNAERDRVYAEGPVSQPGDPSLDGSAEGQVSATEEPPPLPAEAQPPCEEQGSVWTPGYWAWSGTAYFWVSGAWVHPPGVGVLWTPGYWTLVGGVFVFHPGYWGHHVGYYGGINYGHGYFGSGYSGGHWVGTRYLYNTAVSNVNMRVVRDTYRDPVRASFSASRASYRRIPGSTTIISIPRESSASAQPQFEPKLPRQHHRVEYATTSAGAASAGFREHATRSAAPTHNSVTARRMPARSTPRSSPSRGSSHPRLGATPAK